MATKKAKRRTKSAPHIEVTLSDTAAGTAWLNSLTEPEFRDRVLNHVFSRMKKEGAIEAFQNLHGRNDKGIDYLLLESTALQRRIVGVQVKSKDITRTGDSSSLSSLDVKKECEAALAHEFIFQADRVRIDNLAVWTSAHITEDAEKEFYAVGTLAKIQVVKAPAVFALIHRYSPDLLSKIPQCAVSLYLRNKAAPAPKPIKLLGANLDPKQHFLIPQISHRPAASSSRLKTRNSVMAPSRDTIDIKCFVENPKHAVIKGSDLCGKSYLLEHLQALAAELTLIPFLLTPADFASKPRTLFHLFSKILPSFSPNDFGALVKHNRVLLLMDDIDELSDDERTKLFELDPREVTVVGTARSLATPDEVDDCYIVGVDFDSISHFLRSLDQTGKGMVFTDRAHSFISRSLAHSGLPESPFTIAMLLQECQLSPTKFSTPTMGRLIERFIELQLGSHSEETSLVDFESKREFLTRVAGKPELTLQEEALRQMLGRHIHARSLPHEADVFFSDLLQGGIFTRDAVKLTVTWSHPVIKQFFWVKNLLAQNKTTLIQKTLVDRPAITLAAIVGSQLHNAGVLIDALAEELAKVKAPTQQDLVETLREMSPDILPTEESEAEMLEEIEQLADDKEKRAEKRKKVESVTRDYALTDADRARVEHKMGPILESILESKLHIGQNLASLVVNARDTKTPQKERAVKEILLSNARAGQVLHDLMLLLFAGRKQVQRVASWLRIYMTLNHTDAVLGDPFLLTVFKDLLKEKLDDESRVMLIDLILGCGAGDHDLAVGVLRKINRPEITYAIYYRVAALYFFRFHREAEKKSLRRLLAEIRKIHSFARLPPVLAAT